MTKSSMSKNRMNWIWRQSYDFPHTKEIKEADSPNDGNFADYSFGVTPVSDTVKFQTGESK